MRALLGRFLCWDDGIADKREGVSIIAHKPERKNIALVCDDEWEGETNGYAAVIRTPEKILMYYRAGIHKHSADGSGPRGGVSTGVICLAESRDGISFTKPDLGLYEYNGTRHNNIVFMHPDKRVDTFSVMYDENPACPPDERFKALTTGKDGENYRLLYYSSADGVHFEKRYFLPMRGTFDSYNAIVWDKDTEQYFVYYRAFHDKDGTDRFDWGTIDVVNCIRDIRVATSRDFRSFRERGRISFLEGQEDYPLYTNQITKYYRAPRSFIGFPVRYCDRAADSKSFGYMSLADYREKVTEHYGREGTAITDCVIMTSADGLLFNRRDEAFLTPGPENSSNWWYGNCYTAYGMLETAADESGASPEISMYVGEGYRIKKVNFRRMTLRLDGFYSWYAPYSGGEIMTETFLCRGGEMSLNFASSAVGGVRVLVCDESGEPIPGYESYDIFGDSTERPVTFDRPLDELCERRVRLRFLLRDAHIYSFSVE